MIRRGTWIVLAIFALLLDAVLILQNQRGSVKLVEAGVTPSATEQPRLLNGWEAQDIVAVELKGEGRAFNLTKAADGAWTAGPDTPAPVDAAQVDSLLSALASARILSGLGADSPLDSIGLTAPANIIIVQNTQGARSEIRLGGLTPTSSGYYAQVDSNPPVVVSTYNIDTLLSQLKREYWITPEAPAESITTTPAP